jgi:hypothetical protein
MTLGRSCMVNENNGLKPTISLGFGSNTICVRKIEKSAGKCDSLPWEGEGRGFCAMLLRLIIRGYHSSRNPSLPRPEAGIAQGHGLHDLFRTPMDQTPVILNLHLKLCLISKVIYPPNL